MGLTAGSQNVRERECAISVSENVKENESLEDESICKQSFHAVGSKCTGQNQSCGHNCEHKSRDGVPLRFS